MNEGAEMSSALGSQAVALEWHICSVQFVFVRTGVLGIDFIIECMSKCLRLQFPL